MLVLLMLVIYDYAVEMPYCVMIYTVHTKFHED
jgi:hypothetical protein